jgi:mRNA-degrading endonuclease RelE of RelBE toxin-antitoxin system
MNIDINKAALKDIEKLTDLARIVIIEQLTLLAVAENLGSMGNVIKMKGSKHPLYRLKTGHFRIMLEKTDTGVIVLAVVDRKDVYMKKNKK